MEIEFTYQVKWEMSEDGSPATYFSFFMESSTALQMESEPIVGCDGDGCASGAGTWPLHHFRRLDGVHCRLCSSCLLLEYRSFYCCCCFLLLGPEPPAHFDDGDPILAPPVPVATCRLCNEAVAHRYCLQSDDDTFVCAACVAAAHGWRFSYTPTAPPPAALAATTTGGVVSDAPLDIRATRIMLLASRISLAVLRKAAAAARATAERLFVEAKAEKARAYRALAVALGVDAEVPSANHGADEPEPLPMLQAPPPPEDMAPESSSTATNMGALPPSENVAPPESDASSVAMALAMAPPSENLPSEGNLVAMAMGLDLNAPPPSPAADTIGVGDVAEMTMAAEASSSSPPLPPPPPPQPRRRPLQLFPDDDM
ncbi:hypothetical protein [Oryza sativa Japonica Group]|uniref:Uncharacterized protein n=1 Tax=Oryza sativa subsp. japonica TaxID=39947 RepID=Q9LGV4_ORYSJ|nr:hypothetical protein OsJ_01396 [Oryza sativa Japonica Group]BAA96629.1 hypothetical protein [Oryza sativa Japonica Group]